MWALHARRSDVHRTCMLPKVSYNPSLAYGHGCRMISHVLYQLIIEFIYIIQLDNICKQSVHPLCTQLYTLRYKPCRPRRLVRGVSVIILQNCLPRRVKFSHTMPKNEHTGVRQTNGNKITKFSHERSRYRPSTNFNRSEVAGAFFK
jgi:hypothetical protein